MRRRRSMSAGTAVLCPLLAFVAGCAPDEWEPGSTRDLLAREPRGILEDPGTMRPDPAVQWGRLGREGWERSTRRLGERAFVVHHGLEARLVLPCSSEAARPLSLEAWVAATEADPEREVPAVVSLNEIELGAIALGTDARDFDFEVEAGVWRRGENVLSVAVEVGHYRDPSEGLALARIEAGPARRAQRGDDGWRLAPGTGLRYAIESYAPARLALAGTAPGEGTLEVRFTLFDPVTSRPVQDDAPPFRVRAAGTFEAEVPVPTSPGLVVEVELFWRADADATLELTRADVLDRAVVERPPIVLISIDTLSAGHTSLYGYERATTPRLEELAREATVFDTARANAPWTSPSYVSLFSGLYPSSVSMDLGGVESRFMIKLPEGRWTLAEALSASGYHSAGFVDALHIDERFGFAQGFEHFDASAGEIALEDPEGGLRHVVPLALEWLDGLPPGEPFFLFLHAYDVHGPYLPDDPWRGRFRDDERARSTDEMWAATLPHTFGSIPDYIAATPEAAAVPGERVRSAPYVSSYDEEILALDASLGELFDALEERGLLRRSVIVVTADHGESTDDHDYFGHGLLYDEVLRVPLVLRLPDERRDARVPRRVADAVQLVDLYPTLLELAGHTDPRAYLHGRSLLPLLRGGELPPAPTFGEGGIMRQSALEYDGWKLIESSPGIESLPWTMLSNPRLASGWTEQHVPAVAGLPMTLENFNRLLDTREEQEVLDLIDTLRAELGGPVYELYDLGTDPEERRDLAEQEPERRAELLRLLRAAQAEREESRRLVEESRVPLSAADLEELGKLGYVENDG